MVFGFFLRGEGVFIGGRWQGCESASIGVVVLPSIVVSGFIRALAPRQHPRAPYPHPGSQEVSFVVYIGGLGVMVVGAVVYGIVADDRGMCSCMHACMHVVVKRMR